MKISFTLLILSLSLIANSQTYPNIEIKAAAFSEALVTADYQTAVDYFTPEVFAQVDANKLKEIWNQIQDQAGTYKSKAAVTVLKEGEIVASYQALTFENTVLDLKLAFDASESVAGILFLPHKIIELDLVDTDQIFEEEILVKTGKDVELRGILTLPKDATKVPAIILVHGSGPNDMDETYGPNKLFKDLAHGLAEKGIAVIRYTKRTREYTGPPAIDIASLTLYEETIEDAISAVDLAKKDKRIDKKQIYVLGHSLGGMAVPRIGTLSKNTKGIIIMAGNAKPMEDLIYEQYQYLVEEDGIVTPEEESLVVNYEGQLKALEELLQDGETDGILPLGLPAKYWEYLAEYNQVETAVNLKKPILILQGKRDYQVTTTDFQIWKKVLANRADCTFKIYEKLNHQMREGTGPSYPKEYNVKSDLPSYLITDIYEWINSQK
ncbi:MAG: DUF3887 domain-containing protein [Crocinitomix sp.]|nr:DUF3887 domain-containing protein [Crocinitomix sp.]